MSFGLRSSGLCLGLFGLALYSLLGGFGHLLQFVIISYLPCSFTRIVLGFSLRQLLYASLLSFGLL